MRPGAYRAATERLGELLATICLRRLSPAGAAASPPNHDGRQSLSPVAAWTGRPRRPLTTQGRALDVSREAPSERDAQEVPVGNISNILRALELSLPGPVAQVLCVEGGLVLSAWSQLAEVAPVQKRVGEDAYSMTNTRERRLHSSPEAPSFSSATAGHDTWG